MWIMRMKTVSQTPLTNSQNCRGWIRGLGLAIAILISTSGAMAQNTVYDYLKPRINRDQFATYCGQIGIDKYQRGITDLLFEDYSTELVVFAENINNRLRIAGRTRLENVFAGRVSMSGRDLRTLRAKLQIIYRDCEPAADDMMQNLLAGVEGMLSEEQKQNLPAAQRELRRKTMLHPRQKGSRVFSYAGEGVDVLQLVERASTETGAELEGMEDGAIEEIMARYELDLDEVLRQTFSDERRDQLDYSIAKLNQNAEAIAKLQKRLVAYWNKLFELNQSTVKAIGVIIENNSGEFSRKLWEDRFHRMAFEWLYVRTLPDRQVQWIRSSELDSELIQKAEVMYSSYLAGRDMLQREAISLMVRARQERGVTLHPMSLPSDVQEKAGDLHKDLLRNSGSKKNHDTRFAGEFESLLPIEQQRAMRRALRQAYRTR